MTNPGPQYQPQQPGPYGQQPGPYGQQPGQPYPPPLEQSKARGGCMKWGLIIIGVLFAVGLCSVAVSGGDDDSETAAQETTTATFAAETTTQAPAESQSAEPEPAPAQEPEAAEPEVPREYLNALRSAKQYLDYTAFSRDGLVRQLEFENYSNDAAQYAVDNVGANWNEQAAKSAEQYLDYTSFSRQGLVDQLVFEGFTPEQAEYGASQVY